MQRIRIQSKWTLDLMLKRGYFSLPQDAVCATSTGVWAELVFSGSRFNHIHSGRVMGIAQIPLRRLCDKVRDKFLEKSRESFGESRRNGIWA